MKSVMTVDLEYDWETRESKNLAAVPKLLKFFSKHGIRATFFVLGSLAEKNKKLIKEIAKKHEVASHSYDHVDLSQLNENHTAVQVLKSKRVFDSMGIEVKGFRAPYFKTNKFLNKILSAAGFEYDSSKFGNKVSFNGLAEIPVPSFAPFVKCGLPYYRLLYPCSKVFSPKHLFYIHPHEFIPVSKGRSTMPFLLKILGKRNSGEKAWEIFEQFINKNKVKWVSCGDFLKNER